MIKKLLSICALFALVGLTSSAYGQCTPDPQYTDPGVYPDSATNFMNACANSSYQQVVTIIVPADTTVEVVPGFPVTLSMDSIRITNVSGLPAGFTYDCLAAGCAFLGNTTSCLAINGNPTSGDVGNYALVIDLDIFVGGSTTPAQETVDYYVIDVLADTDPACAVGIESLDANEFSVGQNVPNPFSDYSTINFASGSNQNINFTVVDMLGKVVLNRNVSAIQGDNRIRLSANELENGVYLYSITNGANTVTRRMVVSK